jgi:hypothetical protein
VDFYVEGCEKYNEGKIIEAKFKGEAFDVSLRWATRQK